MYAIIESGGKQYKVEKGNVIRVEKLDVEIGSNVTFPALMTASGKTVKVGQPVLKDVTVMGKVLAHDKEKKIVVFHYKAKKDYRKKQGHRQPYTQVEITDIVEGGKKAAEEKPAAEAKPKAESKAKAEIKPQADTKAKAEAKPKAEATAKAETKAKTTAKPKTEPKAKAEAKPKAEPKAKTAAKPKAETKAKPKTEPKAKTEAKPEAEAKKKDEAKEEK